MAKDWDMRLNYRSLGYTFRRFLQFTPQEMRAIVISILIMTFIVAFNDKSETFNFTKWMLNFLVWLFIVGISFMAFIIGQRVASLYEGYIPEYRIWWYGLMVGLIVAFVSRGHLWLLLPGGIYFHMSTIHRTGEFRYGQTTEMMSKISFFGPLSCFFLGAFIKTLEVWFGLSVVSPEFVHNFFLFNMALAAFSLLPIPPLPGSKIFFHSRSIYVFLFGAAAGYAILVMFRVYSLIWALIIGLIIWLVYHITFEKDAWPF